MIKMNKIFTFLVVVSLFSCKNDGAKAPAAEVAPMDEKSGYELTPFEPSQEFADASITGFSYQDGKFKFDIGGDSYSLGEQTPDAVSKMCANSGKGQHIHVLLDDKPYSAQYTSEFEFEIPDGDHTLLAFLSRSYHESIKTDAAHVAKKISVKEKSIGSNTDIEKPMIWHSRPKGTYVGKDAEKVMLDFYLQNIDLGDGNKLRVTIDGVSSFVDKWQPYYITGLEMGEHEITLTIFDSHGHKAHGTNIAKGSFTLKSDAVPGK